MKTQQKTCIPLLKYVQIVKNQAAGVISYGLIVSFGVTIQSR